MFDWMPMLSVGYSKKTESRYQSFVGTIQPDARQSRGGGQTETCPRTGRLPFLMALKFTGLLSTCKGNTQSYLNKIILNFFACIFECFVLPSYSN